MSGDKFEAIQVELLASTCGGQQKSPYSYDNGPRNIPVYGAPNATAIYCNLGHNPTKCSTIPPGGLASTQMPEPGNTMGIP